MPSPLLYYGFPLTVQRCACLLRFYVFIMSPFCFYCPPPLYYFPITLLLCVNAHPITFILLCLLLFYYVPVTDVVLYPLVSIYYVSNVCQHNISILLLLLSF